MSHPHRLSDKEIRELLAMPDTPDLAPPAGLAERIKAEIPADLHLAPAAAPVRRRPHLRPTTLALAATLVVAVGGSFFAHRLYRDDLGLAPPSQAVRMQAKEAEVPEGFADRRMEQAAAGVGEAAKAAPGRADAVPAPPLRLPDPSPDEPEAMFDEEVTVTGESPVIDGASARTATTFSAGADLEERRRELMDRLNALEGPLYVAPPPAPPPAPSPSPSTGGTAEPNAAPYGDVFFEAADTNPFVDPEDDRLSTFGLDVDTGSYTVVRRYLRDGHLPPAEAVRVEEVLNYLDYGDAPPRQGDFAIHAEGAPALYGEGERYYALRFNLRGREVAAADRPPAQLTFVVDVSGSMAQENRLGLVKEALGLLLDQLRADDRVALVVYGSSGRVLLAPTGDRERIRAAVAELAPEGATNAEEGLRLAYELAARHRVRGAINRVILCSDGVANVGETSADAILERIEREAEQGIELTTVGFGMGNYNDVLMERLADAGNGRYAYVDELEEARRIFVEDLTGTLQTIAAEARVQVEFNPEVVARYRLLGYENRAVADARFRDDTVDAGEIGAGHTVTALYELKLHRAPRRGDHVATLRLRYAAIGRGEMVEEERRVTGAEFAASWEAASPALRLTTLVAEYAEVLKRSYWAREGDLEDVFRRAQRLSGDFAGDREVADFVALAGRAAELRRRSGER